MVDQVGVNPWLTAPVYTDNAVKALGYFWRLLPVQIKSQPPAVCRGFLIFIESD